MNTRYPAELLSLMTHLKKLPGVGSKTAERFAFHLLKWPKEEMQAFANILIHLKENLIFCENCGCFKTDKVCPFCDMSKRDSNTLCILGSPKDVFAIEETKSYFGLYQILDRLFSPYDLNYLPNTFDRLKKRILESGVKEVIIALDSTLEGDTTTLVLKKELQKLPNIKISKLATGVPMGSVLEYVDGGTLAKSILGRQIC